MRYWRARRRHKRGIRGIEGGIEMCCLEVKKDAQRGIRGGIRRNREEEDKEAQ